MKAVEGLSARERGHGALEQRIWPAVVSIVVNYRGLEDTIACLWNEPFESAGAGGASI